jgi:hypothetical protein
MLAQAEGSAHGSWLCGWWFTQVQDVHGCESTVVIAGIHTSVRVVLQRRWLSWLLAVRVSAARYPPFSSRCSCWSCGHDVCLQSARGHTEAPRACPVDLGSPNSGSLHDAFADSIRALGQT